MADTEAQQELDLDQMWVMAQVEFQRMFPGRDPRYLPVLKIQDVIGLISQKKEEDEKVGARYRLAKDVFSKILKCIENLGALAIQGASMVFGPSNLCFNAVSYLITTVQNYSKIFAGVTDLFGRISAFLDRFEVYARAKSLGVRLDVHLKKIIYELLQSFMRICAIARKVAREPKALLALKVFSFGTDEGIQEELTTLESLVQRETGMSVALILEAAKINQTSITRGFSEVKGSMHVLDGKVEGLSSQLSGVPGFLERQENAEKRQETDDIKKKQRDKIKLALKIDKESWRSYQEDFLRTRVPETGQWLTNDSQLSTWADRQAFAEPIFALKAREGFGKSYLCSTIIRHLNNLYPPGRPEPRVSVSYYYFEKDNKDDKSVNKALRALVWQLTLNDPAYRKSVAGACDKPEGFGETLELWKQLVINLSKMDATYYIILDGIDEAETEQGKPLLQIIHDVSSMANKTGQLNIRLFLTGRPRAFEEIEKDVNMAIPRIGLGTRNRDDILKYVDSRMDSMDIPKKSGQAVIEELRIRICESLAQGATKLQPREFEEVLEHTGEDRHDTIAREVERLNETLGEEDIQDLNELLVWIIGAQEPLMLSQLEAILLVKNGENSFVPLEEQIRDKYAVLLEVSNYNKTVTLRSDSIIEYFRAKSNAAKDQDNLLAKFGLEEFFKPKLGDRTALIHVDLEEYNVLILKGCLSAICDDVKNDMLLDYIFWWLPEHFADVDLALVSTTSKNFIGPLLLRMFVDKQIIDRWWTAERMWMHSWWITRDDDSGTILNWFKDSAVIREISDNEKEWINGLTSNLKPDEDLFKPTSMVMARRWLQSEDWVVTDTFSWLLGFITKIRSHGDGSERITSSVDPTLDQILDVEEWAKTELKVDKKDSLWVAQMAITLRRYGFYKEAMEKSHIAHDLDPRNWRADICLARTYALQNDYTTAIEILSELISAFRTDQDRMRELRAVFYKLLLAFLGEWNSELSQYDAAMEAFREILEHYPENYEVALGVIMLLKKQGKCAEIMQFLQDMNSATNDQGLSHLIAMYHRYADDPTFHETISFAAQQSNSLEVIKDAYQHAVEAAKKDASKLAILIALRYWFGITLYHDHHSQEDHDEAVHLWEQNIAVADSRGSSWDVRYTRPVNAAKLAFIYLQRAKDAGLSSLTAEESIKRLTFLSSGKPDGNEGEPLEDIVLLLGRLYHLMGQDQQAKESLKGHVRAALDLLSDDDSSNDWQGYKRLALTLAPFDDDVNALAAWSLIGPVEIEEHSNRSKNDDELESNADIAILNNKDRTGKDVDGDRDYGDTDNVDQISQQNLKPPNGFDTTLRVTNEAVKFATETGAAVAVSIIDNGKAIISSVANTNKVVASTVSSNATNSVPTNRVQEKASSSSPQPGARSTPAALREKHGLLRQSCDGCCGHTWTYADDIYACKDCIDIQFEPGCLEKLRNGMLERKVCDKSHEFLYVPNWDEDEHAKIPEGKMKVGEELVAVKDWLNSIRRQWGFDIDFEYKPLKPTRTAFRLMHLLPAADFHADLVCEVFECDLTDHPSYEALSYVWGDATIRVSIWAQQELLWITENLAKALRYLRKPSEARCLWVDAVCIDQRSNQEKSQQVPLMKDIYSHCISDLIWLGEAQADTELAISTLQQLQSLDVHRSNESSKVFTNRLVIVIRDLSGLVVPALRRLLVEPALWQRVWVMQEIASCPRAEIILGHISMPWDTLSSVLDHTHIPDFYHRAYGHQSYEEIVWHLFTKTQVISHQRDVIQGIIPRKKQSLLDVLSRFRASSCSDPRDKIYGLLGLASHDFDIKPDYNKSLSEVYTEVALKAIDLGKDLDIICQSQWPTGVADVRPPDLPSWVPDFSYTMEVNIMFAQRDIFSAGDSKCTASTKNSGGRLMVRAITLGELMPLKPVVVTNRHSWPSDGDRFRSWLPDSLLNGEDSYHTGEDAFQAYWRTIMVDCKAYPIARLDNKEFTGYAHWFIGWRTATEKLYDPRKLDECNDPSNLLDYSGQSASHFPSRRLRLDLINKTFEGWHFATTMVDHYYCMVPNESMEGDLVVVLKGAKVPCVIRPVCNNGQSSDLNFTLIGTAYVHGFMDGEAREWTMQGKLEEQEIFLT